MCASFGGHAWGARPVGWVATDSRSLPLQRAVSADAAALTSGGTKNRQSVHIATLRTASSGDASALTASASLPSGSAGAAAGGLGSGSGAAGASGGGGDSGGRSGGTLQRGFSLRRNSSTARTALDPIRKEGFLFKKAKMFDQWKKRYFVLRNGTLFYYESMTVSASRRRLARDPVRDRAATNPEGRAWSSPSCTHTRTVRKVDRPVQHCRDQRPSDGAVQAPRFRVFDHGRGSRPVPVRAIGRPHARMVRSDLRRSQPAAVVMAPAPSSFYFGITTSYQNTQEQT